MALKNVEFHYSYIINEHTHAHTRKRSRWLMNDLSLRHPPPPPSSPLLGRARDGASWRLMVSSRVMSAGRAWNFAAGSIPNAAVCAVYSASVRAASVVTSVGTAVLRCRDSQSWTRLMLTPAPMRECCDSVTCSLKSDAEETIYKYSNAAGIRKIVI